MKQSLIRLLATILSLLLAYEIRVMVSTSKFPGSLSGTILLNIEVN